MVLVTTTWTVVGVLWRRFSGSRSASRHTIYDALGEVYAGLGFDTGRRCALP